ncbi:DHS-like NAD/FAD-binding domain-containing protein [Auricularia subglabra TFB-10046 SS5]|uniref:DHS-like NAD/FAD-binding domain-containing protein n=1 Tax=Auricularia subglabra (strain TFB-10046 / SS5) TaxID=717982 RepID=J0WV84_AURST|nr:DHS-like NAD/FAD-binding domain-containing protein [Auricularia subglabra TFB-10046 SS5]
MVVTYELSSTITDSQNEKALYDISTQLSRSKRLVVVTGAGVSCSSGIPDFRSPRGLHNLVKRHDTRSIKGRDLFDASVFRHADTAALFYSIVAELKDRIDKTTPSPTHKFLAKLGIEKRILRIYTQNIDGLEVRAGLLCSESTSNPTLRAQSKMSRESDLSVIQLHGDIHRVRCVLCSAVYPCSPDIVTAFREGYAPECPECAQRSATRAARQARPIRIGILRPAILLYNEVHPDESTIGTFFAKDLARGPDFLLIIGTSLRAHGIRRLVRKFGRELHSRAEPGVRIVLVNETAPSAEWKDIIDVHIAASCDEWVARVLDDWSNRSDRGK